MILINHREKFTSGTRVLILKSRHKDGLDFQRTISLVSHDSDEFGRSLAELQSQARPGERIYASASPRNLDKAIRSFKLAQLQNDFTPTPVEFYKSLHSRWVSALMKPENQLERVWLFDCDTDADFQQVRYELTELKALVLAIYPTKNGYHIIVYPFNRSLLTSVALKLLHTNPLMLWGY